MPDMHLYKEKVEETVAFLESMLPEKPRIILVLGTGLGSLAQSVKGAVTIPYEHIPNFPKSTATSHAGNLICGRLGGNSVAILQGRFHYYEGYSTKELTFPIRVLSLLGPKILIITNASGGLNTSFAPGTVMIIQDHLNFIGENPLRGPNIDEWGPRFPDLSEPYDKKLADITEKCAKRLNLLDISSGVYVGIPGPSLETPAETRHLKNCGADAVGMSSVPEVIVGIHAGMKVIGLSVVSNVNDPDNFAPILIEDVIDKANKAEPRLQKLIIELLKELKAREEIL